MMKDKLNALARYFNKAFFNAEYEFQCAGCDRWFKIAGEIEVIPHHSNHEGYACPWGGALERGGKPKAIRKL